MSDAMLVELDHVSKTYFSDEVETAALTGVTLRVERGEYVAIEGPSGCGKTTLLSIIGLLEHLTTGGYALDGRSMERMSSDDRAAVRNREVGFIFQNFNLIGDLSVGENVELPLIYRGVTKRERRHRVADVLEQVGMSNRALRYPGQLSGGQQQRVAVARALAAKPTLLLADEPTGNLDTANGASVMALLAELHVDGSTIIMVTHDPRFAGYATRTVRLLDGVLHG
jgi:putative ABC transport system ATP-binding protein